MYVGTAIAPRHRVRRSRSGARCPFSSPTATVANVVQLKQFVSDDLGTAAGGAGTAGAVVAGGAAQLPVPPLRLDACVDEPVGDLRPRLLEPLPYLLAALVRCVVAGKSITDSHATDADTGERRTQLAAVRQLLDRLATRLSRCEPEEYDLDKDTDVSASTGLRNLLRGSLLMGAYEVGRTLVSSPRDGAVLTDRRLRRGVGVGRFDRPCSTTSLSPHHAQRQPPRSCSKRCINGTPSWPTCSQGAAARAVRDSEMCARPALCLLNAQRAHLVLAAGRRPGAQGAETRNARPTCVRSRRGRTGSSLCSWTPRLATQAYDSPSQATGASCSLLLRPLWPKSHRYPYAAAQPPPPCQPHPHASERRCGAVHLPALRRSRRG